MSMAKRQFHLAKVAAGATVVAATAASLNLLWPGNGSSNVADDGSSVVEGDGNEVRITYERFVEEARAASNEEEIRALAEDYEDVAPRGEGPWPYWVVVSPDGLKVRTTGTRDGVQIGTAGNESIVWVECVAVTDFTPPAIPDVGPVWLRVRWPTDEPGMTFDKSAPDAPHRGYVYSGYAVPAGHNGDVPRCDGTGVGAG